MPWTIACFNEDRASAVTTLTPLDCVPDTHLKVVGEDLFIPALNQLFGYQLAHGLGTSPGKPTGGRLESPSLRRLLLVDVPTLYDSCGGLHSHTENLAASYTQNATTALAEPGEMALELFPTMPIPLDVDEALNVLMTNDAVTGARGYAAVFRSDGPVTPVEGDIRTIKCTTTLTPTANQWSSGSITPVQDLPVGTYQLVGAKLIGGDTAGYFRFIPIGGPVWRPGGIISRSVREKDIRPFRRGGLGVWLEFTHNVLPQIEVMELAAVSNPDLYIDVIKTG